jgi:hypothetical protein
MKDAVVGPLDEGAEMVGNLAAGKEAHLLHRQGVIVGEAGCEAVTRRGVSDNKKVMANRPGSGDERARSGERSRRARKDSMSLRRGTVDKRALNARVDGLLPPERMAAVELYLAEHPEEQERWSRLCRAATGAARGARDGAG